VDSARTTGREVTIVAAETARRWATDLLQAAGLRKEAGWVVAEALVDADLKGIHSHGLIRLPVYARRIRARLVNPDPHPRVAIQHGALAKVDGDQGPGQVASAFATELTVRLACEHGVAVTLVRRSTHFGAAGFYAERVALQGLVGIVASNAEPDVVPYGGAEPRLGTNPLAFAAPAPSGPIVLDMATSQAAMGKILARRATGEPLPDGWAVDSQGRPTNDPAAARAAVPLGGPKGYGLALMIEVLAGVASGAGVTGGIGRMYDDWTRSQNVGHFFLALDPGRAIGTERFLQRMAMLAAEMTGTPPVAGFDEVCLPGELERRLRERRLREGLPLPAEVESGLSALAEEFGVKLEA
jgi:ureidoglycolate dehydrogenase (NAD+)